MTSFGLEEISDEKFRKIEMDFNRSQFWDRSDLPEFVGNGKPKSQFLLLFKIKREHNKDIDTNYTTAFP